MTHHRERLRDRQSHLLNLTKLTGRTTRDFRDSQRREFRLQLFQLLLQVVLGALAEFVASKVHCVDKTFASRRQSSIARAKYLCFTHSPISARPRAVRAPRSPRVHRAIARLGLSPHPSVAPVILACVARARPRASTRAHRARAISSTPIARAPRPTRGVAPRARVIARVTATLRAIVAPARRPRASRRRRARRPRARRGASASSRSRRSRALVEDAPIA